MNTRTPIQPSTQPAVLSVSFSSTTGTRFITALSDGLRCFRTDNCLTTYQPSLPDEGGIAIAEALDDRYIAYVAGGRAPAGKGSVVVFWDAVIGKEVCKFDFREEVKGVRLSRTYLVVVLKERTVVFEHQQLERESLPTPPPNAEDDSESTGADAEALQGPNIVKALFPTSPQLYALACLRGDLLALPAQTIGQVQLISLSKPGTSSKRVLRAHTGLLRRLTLSSDGSILATASEQGTLIRIFSTKSTDQVFEFRRGVDPAIIFSLAFSPGNRWLACTSDKGTLHIFDLRPPDPATVAAEQDRLALERHQQRRNASHRLSGAHAHQAYENASSVSGGAGGHSIGRSSPTSATGTYQGSVQEYYSLRPVPYSASPPTPSVGISAMAAFKASAWAPKVFKDVRSVASASFHMGNEGTYWQGGAGYTWTIAPNGTKKRVRNQVAPLPNDPNGRPAKGIIAFKAASQSAGKATSKAVGGEGGEDDEGATIYVVGGGSDARWEVFDLLPATDGVGGWGLVKGGFRKYLSRQFVD